MALPLTKPISDKALSFFYRQMATLEESGMTPAESIAAIEEQFKSSEFRTILGHIRSGAQEGRSVSAMMEQHPKVFSPLQCSLVQAGETGGTMGEIYGRLADHLEKMSHIRDQILVALLYPAIVLHVGVLLLAIIDFFRDGWGAALLSILLHLGVLYGVLIVGWATHRNFRRSQRWHRFLDAIPWVGSVRKKLSQMLFTRTLGALLASGVTASLALEQAGEASGSPILRMVGLKTAELVEGGRGIAEAFVAVMIFPPLILQMMDVGEKSGRMPETMAKTAQILEDEAGHALNIMMRVLPIVSSLIVFAFLGTKIVLFYTRHLGRLPGC
ncbi:MAG: type II secretion system F family protein [Planctomycetota bacterium]|nr:type II secretion system F family protein [Planctomycetota bacterium]